MYTYLDIPQCRRGYGGGNARTRSRSPAWLRRRERTHSIALAGVATAGGTDRLELPAWLRPWERSCSNARRGQRRRTAAERRQRRRDERSTAAGCARLRREPLGLVHSVTPRTGLPAPVLFRAAPGPGGQHRGHPAHEPRPAAVFNRASVPEPISGLRVRISRVPFLPPGASNFSGVPRSDSLRVRVHVFLSPTRCKRSWAVFPESERPPRRCRSAARRPPRAARRRVKLTCRRRCYTRRCATATRRRPHAARRRLSQSRRCRCPRSPFGVQCRP